MTDRFADSRFVGFLLFVSIAICALVGWMAWESRNAAVHHAVLTGDHLAEVMDQHTVRTVATIDLTLAFVESRLRTGSAAASSSQVHDFLRERVARSPVLERLMVVDSEHRLLADSASHPVRPTRVEPRFQAQLQLPENAPLQLGILPDGMLTVGRVMNRRDRRPGLTILAAINPALFARVFDRNILGPNGALSLFTREGALLARESHADGLQFDPGLAARWRAASEGSFEQQSLLDGSVWLNSYRHVEDLPLVVMVSIDKLHALQGWRQESAWQAALGLLLVGVILGFGRFAWAQTHRRIGAEGRELATRGDLDHKHAVIETILRTLPDGVCLLDRQLDIVACNDQLFHIFGLDRRAILQAADSGQALKEALTAAFGQLLPMAGAGPSGHHWPIDHLPGHQPKDSSVTTGRVGATSYVRHQLPDGRWIECRHTRVAGHGFLSVYRDMTDDARRETALQEAYARSEEQTRQLAAAAEELLRERAAAERANQTKSRFLANMSHELRTPLNAINGFSEMIAGLHLGRNAIDKYQEYARDIHASGQHLLELINGVLDLSKIEAGKMELREETVDLAATLYTALRMVEARAESRGIALNLETPRHPVLLRGDAQKLLQSVLNVLSNAVKFTPTGGRVTSTLTSTAAGVAIIVRDTGIGIAPSDMDKVFEPFAQVDSDIARADAGSGLGMPLTRSFVEMHGGAVSIDSAKGVGTTVTLRLPADRVLPFQPIARSV